MSDAHDQPEPDRLTGAPHPRMTPHLFGHADAQADFLDVFNSHRLHHGWLITGPRGVGKATLAWRIARFLLANPPDDGGLFGAPPKSETLDLPDDHPVMHRTRALSEPGLFLLRRGGSGSTDSLREKNWNDGKFAAEILVSQVRKLNGFFSLSAADGGRRVVIIDAADEMNIQSANAILKMLEEPPARTTLLMIAHQPSRLLPTIRSRCRELRLHSLGADDLNNALQQAGAKPAENPAALAELASGSVGAAFRLSNLDGMKIYAELVGLYNSLPNLDRARAQSLAQAAAMRGGEEKLDLMLALNDLLLARLARTGALGQPPQIEAAAGESDMLTRLSPNPHKARAWANTAQAISARVTHARAVNLDPAALVLDTVFKLQNTAAG